MKKKLNKRTVVIVISALVLIAVCGILAGERISGLRAAKVQSETKQLMELGKQSAAAAAAVLPSAEPRTEPAEPVPAEAESGEEEPITADEQGVENDFLPLLKENENLVGWLTAGDSIDFPVVQLDNAFYLNHNFFGEADNNGTPFLDEENSLEPRDDVLMIHGHHMKSGAMFGRLKRYLDFDYLCENPIVTFRTVRDEEDVYYTPIAAINISLNTKDKNYFSPRRFNFDSDEAFQAYLNEVTSRSAWRAKTDAVPGDDLLVLATCSYIYGYGRLLLVCRALREGETPASVTALYTQQADLK